MLVDKVPTAVVWALLQVGCDSPESGTWRHTLGDRWRAAGGVSVMSGCLLLTTHCSERGQQHSRCLCRVRLLRFVGQQIAQGRVWRAGRWVGTCGRVLSPWDSTATDLRVKVEVTVGAKEVAPGWDPCQGSTDIAPVGDMAQELSTCPGTHCASTSQAKAFGFCFLTTVPLHGSRR